MCIQYHRSRRRRQSRRLCLDTVVFTFSLLITSALISAVIIIYIVKQEPRKIKTIFLIF